LTVLKRVPKKISKNYWKIIHNFDVLYYSHKKRVDGKLVLGDSYHPKYNAYVNKLKMLHSSFSPAGVYTNVDVFVNTFYNFLA
jgi:hypothetical protein